MARAAWHTIETSPFFGDYASETIGYAHNALSAWVSFGLGGFLLYVGLVVWAFAGSAVRLLSAPTSERLSSVRPRIEVRTLLKSWAIPLASVPSASIFCACRT